MPHRTRARTQDECDMNSYQLSVTSHPCMCRSGKKCPVDADGTSQNLLKKGTSFECSTDWHFFSLVSLTSRARED